MIQPLIDRSPDARERRARAIAHEWYATRKPPVFENEDPEVVAYARFLTERCHLDARQQDAYCRLRPVLTEYHYLVGGGRAESALHIFQASQSKPQRSPADFDRAVAKALVLGGMPTSEVAQELGFKPQAMAMFERMTWDVRARANNRYWLHNYVLRHPVFEPADPYDFECLCLLFVYKFGIEGFQRHLYALQETSEEAVDALRREVAHSLAAKSSIAVATLAVNQHTAPELLKTHLGLSTDDAAKLPTLPGGATTTDKRVPEFVAGVMRGMSLTVAPQVRDVDAEVVAEEPPADKIWQQTLAEVMAEAGTK